MQRRVLLSNIKNIIYRFTINWLQWLYIYKELPNYVDTMTDWAMLMERNKIFFKKSFLIHSDIKLGLNKQQFIVTMPVLRNTKSWNFSFKMCSILHIQLKKTKHASNALKCKQDNIPHFVWWLWRFTHLEWTKVCRSFRHVFPVCLKKEKVK